MTPVRESPSIPHHAEGTDSFSLSIISPISNRTAALFQRARKLTIIRQKVKSCEIGNYLLL